MKRTTPTNESAATEDDSETARNNIKPGHPRVGRFIRGTEKRRSVPAAGPSPRQWSEVKP